MDHTLAAGRASDEQGSELVFQVAKLRYLICLGALLMLAVEARAGLETAPSQCDAACVTALRQFAGSYMAEHAPLLSGLPERFETAALASGKDCPARNNPGAAVYGVMLGPGEIEGLTKLKGPANDIELMRQVMLDRGVTASFISTAQGAAASRSAMLEAMAKPLACLREGDQVVLVYTGWGTIYPHEWLDFNGFFAAFCQSVQDATGRGICGRVNAGDAEPAFVQSVSEAIDWAVKDWLIAMQPASAYLPGRRQHVLIGSDSVIGTSGVEHLSGVTALELSNFVTRVRNRGADAVLIIDTRLAASGDLYALQLQASASPVWAASGTAMMQYNGFPPIQDAYVEKGPVALFGAGQFAVLYASDVDSEAYEYRQGEGEEARELGALVFRVAEVLRSDSAIRFKDMALAIATSFDQRNRQVEQGGKQDPMFQTSNLDLALLAPRAVAPRQPMGEIEIISPSPKRGASAPEDESFTVVARYTGTGRARMAIIDGDLVPVDDNGQFRGEVSEAGSKFSLALRVLGGNYETLATAALKLRDKPAEPVIAAPARRLALVIANDTYDNAAYPALKTPLADAEAIAAILRQRFGFATEIDGGQGRLNLFLHNATKAQVQEMLFQLRRRLTAEDQLLIYYAGHGENDPDLGAYWVPVDGQPDADFSWIDANEITRELKRMNAASVLVISDSCYAGGLSRGGASATVGAAARERYLAKASRLKARQLMASGGDEPVEDGGGAGHSVFAKALIEALAAMPEQTFTASELFEQKVKPAVIAAINALSVGQTPGYSRISKAGDEPGSEFVFQAVAAGLP